MHLMLLSRQRWWCNVCSHSQPLIQVQSADLPELKPGIPRRAALIAAFGFLTWFGLFPHAYVHKAIEQPAATVPLADAEAACMEAAAVCSTMYSQVQLPLPALVVDLPYFVRAPVPGNHCTAVRCARCPTRVTWGVPRRNQACCTLQNRLFNCTRAAMHWTARSRACGLGNTCSMA